jgi:predicted Zn finger-like uncharacterized protein
MIVQCPSCETKFSVDSSQVQKIAHPRFHCSRCNHIFELSGKTSGAKKRSTTSNTPLFPFEQDDQSTEREFELSLEDVTKHQQPLGLSVETYEQPTKIAKQLELIPEKKESEFRLATDGKRYQRRYIAGITDDSEELPTITADWPDASPIESKREQMDSSQSTSAIVSQTKINQPQINQIRINQIPINETPINKNTASSIPATPAFSYSPSSSYSQSKSQPVLPPISHANSWTTFYSTISTFGAPGVFALLLLFASYWLKDEANHFSIITSLVPAISERVPPSGIDVTGLHSRKITLSDGSSALEIVGNVMNASSKVYRGVQVEAKTYDYNNRPLASLRAHTSNLLPDHASESAANIIKLQSEAGPSFRLKPNEKLPFRVVLPAELDQARYFSASVFSVIADSAV